MQTYLKTKPVWIQILLFLGMAFGILMAVFIIGTFILSRIWGLGFAEFSEIASVDSSHPAKMKVLRGMLFLQFAGLFLIPSLLFGYFSDPKPRRYLGLKKPDKIGYWMAGSLILLMSIPVVEYIGDLNRNIHFGGVVQSWAKKMEEEATKTIQFLLSRNTIGDLILNLVFIAGFAAVGEELLFRGVLQRLFIKGTRSPWLGIIIAAFFFSFFHFQFFGFIPRFLLGMLLGAAYWYSGSLWIAIAAHFVYDAFIIVLAYFKPEVIQQVDAPLVNKSYLGIVALLSAVLVGFLLWWMKKNSKTTYEEVYEEDNSNPTEKDFTF